MADKQEGKDVSASAVETFGKVEIRTAKNGYQVHVGTESVGWTIGANGIIAPVGPATYVFGTFDELSQWMADRLSDPVEG